MTRANVGLRSARVKRHMAKSVRGLRHPELDTVDPGLLSHRVRPLQPASPPVGGWLVAFVLVVLLVLTALTFVWRQYDDRKGKAEEELRARAVLAATVFDTYFAGQLAAHR